MTKPHRITLWPNGVPPAAGPGEPRLRFALRRCPTSLDAISGYSHCSLVVLRDWTWIGGRGGYFCDAVLGEHQGVASHDNFMCALHDCIALFDFLPPVSVVEALAESRGLIYAGFEEDEVYDGAIANQEDAA